VGVLANSIAVARGEDDVVGGRLSQLEAGVRTLTPAPGDQEGWGREGENVRWDDGNFC